MSLPSNRHFYLYIIGDTQLTIYQLLKSLNFLFNVHIHRPWTTIRHNPVKMAAPQLSKTVQNLKSCFAMLKKKEFYLHAGCCSTSSSRSWPCRLPGRHSPDTRPRTHPRARSDYPRNGTHCNPSLASRSNNQTVKQFSRFRLRLNLSVNGRMVIQLVFITELPFVRFQNHNAPVTNIITPL